MGTSYKMGFCSALAILGKEMFNRYIACVFHLSWQSYGTSRTYTSWSLKLEIETKAHSQCKWLWCWKTH